MDDIDRAPKNVSPWIPIMNPSISGKWCVSRGSMVGRDVTVPKTWNDP